MTAAVLSLVTAAAGVSPAPCESRSGTRGLPGPVLKGTEAQRERQSTRRGTAGLASHPLNPRGQGQPHSQARRAWDALCQPYWETS